MSNRPQAEQDDFFPLLAAPVHPAYAKKMHPTALHGIAMHNHRCQVHTQVVAQQLQNKVAGLSLEYFVDGKGQKWAALMRPAGGGAVTRRPLTLYSTQVNNQERIAIQPGTVSLGTEDLSISDDGDVLTVSVPAQSKDLVLRLDLVPGAMALAYLADPQTIRYYAQGVASVFDWAINWETPNQQSERAEVDPVSGEPTVTGAYYVRIGRATVNGETVTLTNYKYGPLAINLCANGDLVIAQLEP
jgi:hypothetical protein